MISTAVKGQPSPPTLSQNTLVVADLESTSQQSLAAKLKTRILSLGSSLCLVISPTEINTAKLENTACIFLPELERSVFSNTSARDYNNLKRIISTTEGLFWLGYNEGPTKINP